MPAISLMINILPTPEEASYHKGSSIEDQVDCALNLVESGHESKDEWEFLQKVNNYLLSKEELNSSQKSLLEKILPVLRKYKDGSRGYIDENSDKLSKHGLLFPKVEKATNDQ